MKSRLSIDDFDLEDSNDDPLNLVPQELFHLIPGFLDRREKEIVDLREMLVRQDYGAIRDTGHRLRGMGAGYGFDLISEIGREMETAALASDRAVIESLVTQLALVTQNLKALLRLRQGGA